ncbi:ferritin-like fold-containing protein [Angustibacter aerolatus]
MTQPPVDDDPFADPEHRAAVVDLLGAMAYGELTAFSRLAADAELAPTLADKASLGRQSAGEFRHYELLEDRLREMGADVRAAMQPFVTPIDEFHDRTRPSTWLEGLVKAYVGDGIAGDFYREVAEYLDERTRELVHEVLQDMGQADFAVQAVRAAVERDPSVAGRLALWGRRLVGEALSQAQRVAAERDALSSLLIGSATRRGADLAEIGRMFARLTEEHTRRMGRLGMSA